jgi:hypothetical protein
MKYINMPEKTADDIIAELTEKLKAMFTESRNITAFTYSFKPEEFIGKAEITLDFSAIAFLKQHMLVANHKDEIAWHGIVRPSEDRKCFHIEDILIYPQTVTGTNVNTDEVPYQDWKNKLDDDHYNHLRYQAHSHVNMTVSPSGTDTTLYDAMLSTLGPTSYYIFLIINKRGEFWINIYDIQNNVIYDKNDVHVTVDGMDMDAWYDAQIKEYIKPKTYQPATTYIAPGFQVAAATKEDDEKKIVKPGTTAITNETTGNRQGIIELPGQTNKPGKFIYGAPYETKGLSDQEKALLKRYEQLRKAGAQYPIYCVGCKHAKKFNAKRPPCQTCDILVEAEMTEYANSQQ